MTARKAAVDKLKVGRPTTYDPKYCAEVEADMAEGYSLTAFAGKIGVDRKTLDNWQEANPEFLLSVARAKARRLREWEGMGIAIAKKGAGGPGGSTMVIFGLKNMGDGEWADKTEHDHTSRDGSMSPKPNVIVFEAPGADAEGED